MPAQVGAVVTRIGEKYREAALILVAKAYSTIKIADLAVYLGQVIDDRIFFLYLSPSFQLQGVSKKTLFNEIGTQAAP